MLLLNSPSKTLEASLKAISYWKKKKSHCNSPLLILYLNKPNYFKCGLRSGLLPLFLKREREQEKDISTKQQQLRAAARSLDLLFFLAPHVVISVTRVFHPTHDVRSAVQGAAD
jgi:hypothetical protein